MTNRIHCESCGASGLVCNAISEHEIENLGIRVIVRNAAKEIFCPDCGESSISLPDFNGLLATAALALIYRDVCFGADEMRFVRSVAGMTMAEADDALGRMLGNGQAPDVGRYRWQEEDPSRMGGFVHVVAKKLFGHRIAQRYEGIDFQEDQVSARLGPPTSTADAPVVLELVHRGENGGDEGDWELLKAA